MSQRPKTLSDSSLPVLIVDDNPHYSQLLQRILAHAFGYSNISSVTSTEEALVLINSQPDKFKLLFVDHNFPSGNTGGELLEKLKASQLLDDKVAFLVTSEPTVDNQKQAQTAGACGVVAKPFDREKLKRQLEKAEMQIKADNMESF